MNRSVVLVLLLLAVGCGSMAVWATSQANAETHFGTITRGASTLR